ncbi:MAG: gliding motility-associated C-terminal domain-containing protein, partial [Chitinophagales bacterium]|nr:gliding motility-associated C-terminal domain-containing protein [Chitinophagales bacterium]
MHTIKKILILGLVILPLFSSATHNRAGEIIYRLIAPFTYEIEIITYSKDPSSADRDSLKISWGDGATDWLYRANGPDGNGNGIPDGELLKQDIKKNVYPGVHQYPGSSSFYILSMNDPNRISSIVNIGNSVNVPFYIEDTIYFNFNPNQLGFNNSPVLLTPPIDFANVLDTFYHNPNAYDPDGDSLTYTLIPPKQSLGTDVPLYQNPDQFPVSANNNFTLNKQTGEIIWATPQSVGIYNIAILVREYRRVGSQAILMGTLVRDMQIIVDDNLNDPPRIKELKDTCVIAGESLILNVSADDPDVGQNVTLTAEGGPFITPVNPATFSDNVGNPATGTFTWNTACDHIRPQFYQVVFKAEDNFSVPLTDLESWQIKVVAPAPENLIAQAQADKVTVSWDDPYQCASFANFIGFSVWRRLGSNNFTPEKCETGLAGRGYIKIASRQQNYSFEDFNVNRGNEYCYRVMAHFAQSAADGTEFNQVKSIPSNEVCIEMIDNVPILTKVSVLETDASTGSIQLSWIPPSTDTGKLDTLIDGPPYTYDIMRADGLGGSNYILIKTVTRTSFHQLKRDTSHIDSLINTSADAFNYKIDFYSNGNLIGSSDPASSIFLSIAATDRRLKLSWDEEVPWANFKYDVLKLNPLTSIFDSIATVDSAFYEDQGLINDSLYCYRIRSYGEYNALPFLDTLKNWSQEACATPIDTVAPCEPIVNVSNNCENFLSEPQDTVSLINFVSWSLPDNTCGADIIQYKIFFGESLVSQFVQVGSTFGLFDTTFAHDLTGNPSGLAGCYSVAAVDEKGNESDLGPIECIDN